jgi:hypothetical protein
MLSGQVCPALRAQRSNHAGDLGKFIPCLAACADDVFVIVVAAIGQTAFTQLLPDLFRQNLIQVTPLAATSAIRWRNSAVSGLYAIQPDPAPVPHAGLAARLD